MTYIFQVEDLHKCYQALNHSPRHPVMKVDIAAKKVRREALRRAREAVAPLIAMFHRELCQRVWVDLEKELMEQAGEWASDDVEACAEEWLEDFEQKVCVFVDNDDTERWHTWFVSAEWAALVAALREFAAGPPPPSHRFGY